MTKIILGFLLLALLIIFFISIIWSFYREKHKCKKLINKCIYKHKNEPVYITGYREKCIYYDDKYEFIMYKSDDIPGNFTEPDNELHILTYSKFDDSNRDCILSFPIYGIHDVTDEKFRDLIINSNYTKEKIIEYFFKPIRPKNIIDYEHYMEIFSKIKTYGDIEKYHTNLIKYLIDKYNKVMENCSEKSLYINNDSKIIEDILKTM